MKLGLENIRQLQSQSETDARVGRNLLIFDLTVARINEITNVHTFLFNLNFKCLLLAVNINFMLNESL